MSASALFWHFWRAAPVNNGPLFYASTEAGNVVEFPLPLLHLLPFFPSLSHSIVAAYVWLHTKNNGAIQAEAAGGRNRELKLWQGRIESPFWMWTPSDLA